MPSLKGKVETAFKDKISSLQKQDVGYESLMAIQDLKILHNEFDIPVLIDSYIKKYGITNDILNF